MNKQGCPYNKDMIECIPGIACDDCIEQYKSKEDNNVFKREDIKTFSLEELEGKILKISVLKTREMMIVSGKEQTTGETYMIINSKFEKLNDSGKEKR